MRLAILTVVLFQAAAVLADPGRLYQINLAKHDRWVRVAPSLNPAQARVKADHVQPKGLAYEWELKPTPRNQRAFEIVNAATHQAVTGFDKEGWELTASPGQGSTWEITQYHGSHFVIRLADTNLVWTYDQETDGHGGGSVRLLPYSDDVPGQVWTFTAENVPSGDNDHPSASYHHHRRPCHLDM